MSERDFPVGHPAAADYAGESYRPPRAPWAEDFDPEHPARNGGNTNELDTPDGMRAALLQRSQDLDELRSVGALPAEHPSKFSEQPASMAQEREAREYLKTRGYSEESAEDILTRYGIEAVLQDKAKFTQH